MSLLVKNDKYRPVSHQIITRRPLLSLLLVLWIGSAHAADQAPGRLPSDVLEIRSVSVHGKLLNWHPGNPLRLGANTEDIRFVFGPVSNAIRQPIRLRYKLEGVDNAWKDGPGEMFVSLRFFDDPGKQLGAPKVFPVERESTGWNGTLESSLLTHRRETVVVPPQATRMQVIISSAGPPATVGIYAIDDLVVSKVTTNKSLQVLLPPPFADNEREGAVNLDPPGWIRDGMNVNMATIVELGKDPKTKALAILDDDPDGHAEWRTRRQVDPRVAPGDNLVVEWNELYSVGLGGITQEAYYNRLPPGDYRFRVAEVNLYGKPTRVEDTLVIRVSHPFWETPWGWALLAGGALAASIASMRYVARRRMQRTMSLLRQQQALEQERLRIAQDIHDDLGARVTQISLLSALAQNDPTLPDQARTNFDRISQMSRELVSALYETVWAVNPENDNLDAVGNYLCQRINEFCTQAHLRCRLNVDELPHDIEVSSQTRHNISMAVKEAVHNVIKHAHASQITVRVTFSEMVLTVSVEDDGKGFQPDDAHMGNGRPNMTRRLADIGGSCLVESYPGRGTTVHMRLRVQSLSENGRGKDPAPDPAASGEPPSTDLPV